MVKAEFPIGKTQWAKWNDMQRRAFNALRQQGKSFEAAVKYINSPGFADIDGPEPKKSIFDVIEDAVEDVADVAATVGSVAAAVSPVVAVAKTVAKVTKGKKGK